MASLRLAMKLSMMEAENSGGTGDKERRKVLVDFGDGYSDWMHFNVLKDLELVEDGMLLNVEL